MRRKRRKSIKKQILAVATAMVFTILAPAQSQAQQVRTNIPFTFQAGNTMMPAGEYQVQSALLGTKSVQQIRRTDSSTSTFVGTYGVDPRDKDAKPKLVFHCYSNECFLSEIWDGSGPGRELLRSRREKELAHAKTENELVVVVLPVMAMP
jgi:hypothetical protein